MSIVNWCTGIFSKRSRALSLYRRGMARAKKLDHQGAIDDYTILIEMPDAKTDVKAMALYNRATVYAARGETSKACHDLNLVLAMPETLSEIKTESRRKLMRLDRRSKINDPSHNSDT